MGISWITLRRALYRMGFFRRVDKTTGNIALPARALDETITRILLVKLDHIGDFVVALEAMETIRETWPEARITLLCGPWNVGLAEASGLFDRVVAHRFFVDKASEETLFRDRGLDALASLLPEPFDLAIDLRHDADTRVVLDHVDARRRAGYAAPRLARSLDLSLPPVENDGDRTLVPLHATTRLTLLAAAVKAVFAPPARHPIRRLLTAPPPGESARPFAVLATGAGSPVRQWEIDRYARVVDHLIERQGLDVVLVGGPSESAINRTIAAAARPGACDDRTGGPIAALPTLLAGARLFVGNDTGVTHMAAMLGVPTVCLYGGVSDPAIWQPIGPRVALVHAKVACAYCHFAHLRECKSDRACMTEISVADVTGAIDRMLAATEAAAAP